MARIGFHPSYMNEEGDDRPSQPPMQQVVVDGKEKENDLLTEAKNRLKQAKVFMLTAAYKRLSDRGKAIKLQELEFLVLVVAQLS